MGSDEPRPDGWKVFTLVPTQGRPGGGGVQIQPSNHLEEAGQSYRHHVTWQKYCDQGSSRGRHGAFNFKTPHTIGCSHKIKPTAPLLRLAKSIGYLRLLLGNAL